MRLPNKQDWRVHTEGGQARYRVRAATVANAGVWAMSLYSPPNIESVLLGVSAYLLFSLLLLVAVACELGRPRPRQLIALVLDQLILNGTMAWGGLTFAPLLWSGVIASIGHGLRFSPRRGQLSAFLGATLAGLALLASPSWRELPLMSLGIVLGSLLLPIYAVTVAHQITRGREDAEARALTLEALARRDGLTGLLNRSGLQECMAALQQQDARRPATLAFIDLDGFKTVNDQAGHDMGDAVLRQVAQALLQVVDPQDVVARLGGDEFAILVTSARSQADLHTLGQRLTEAVQQVHPPQRPELRVEASIGMWSFEADEEHQRVLRQADQLMYRCKQTGGGSFQLGGHPLTEAAA
jgi:diguanylate cyclase (GGDEF)-like protein